MINVKTNLKDNKPEDGCVFEGENTIQMGHYVVQ